jgi:glycine cleavage system H protein
VGAVAGIKLLEESDDIVQGTPCAHILSQDGLSHDLLAPISGTIVETHMRLCKEVTLLKRDPCGEGWLYRVIPADVSYEVEQLTVWSTVAAGPLKQTTRGSGKHQ